MLKNRQCKTVFSLVALVMALLALSAAAYAADAKPDAKEHEPKKAYFDPVIKHIEGWTVHVDPKLLEGEHAEEGGRALQ